jgi:hypothetical protein
MTVAVEVSAYRGGTYEEASFLDFVLGSLAESAYVSAAWTTRRLGASAPSGLPVARGVRGPIAERLGAMGAALPLSWASPSATVRHLASGPRNLRLAPRSVVTVHRVQGAHGLQRDAPGSRAIESLRRAAGKGVVIHAVTQQLADALIERVQVDRSAVVVAHPGVAWLPPAPGSSEPGIPKVAVLASGERELELDVAILDGLLATGLVSAVLEDSPSRLRWDCIVIGRTDEGFPAAAIEALGAGMPVVAARTPTTTELLGGSACLVDKGVVTDFVEAAVDTASNESARAVAVAAGRARAADFTWARRVGDLKALYLRAQRVR